MYLLVSQNYQKNMIIRKKKFLVLKMIKIILFVLLKLETFLKLLQLFFPKQQIDELYEIAGKLNNGSINTEERGVLPRKSIHQMGHTTIPMLCVN